jgi:membrane-associated phospholipid phosphatase
MIIFLGNTEASLRSHAYSVERSKEHKFIRTLNKRILLFALAYSVQLLYIPTSARVSGGIEPKLSIDIFPIWVIWVVPYVLCYALWLLSVIWIILNTEDRVFRAFLAACSFTFTFGVLLFILFPTYVKPDALPGNDIFTILLRMLHTKWGRYDAFPSGHIYLTTLLVLFFSRWYPRQRFVWIFTLLIVSLSTLFTHQHYIVDVLGGYAVAFTGYHFGLWWAGFYPSEKGPDKRISSSVN